MSLVKSLLKLHPDKNSFVDILGDLRTISAAILVVGGVGRFFGFHDQHYVRIAAVMSWVFCVLSAKFIRKVGS